MTSEEKQGIQRFKVKFKKLSSSLQKIAKASVKSTIEKEHVLSFDEVEVPDVYHTSDTLYVGIPASVSGSPALTQQYVSEAVEDLALTASDDMLARIKEYLK